MITGLILAGLLVLVIIVYSIQIVEKGNLEKARKRAELTDRCRRCADLSDGLPGQMMTPALKLLLPPPRAGAQRAPAAAGQGQRQTGGPPSDIARRRGEG